MTPIRLVRSVRALLLGLAVVGLATGGAAGSLNVLRDREASATMA